MKLKYEFIFQQLGNTYIGVAVGDGAEEFGGMLELDEVAYDMVSRMTKEISREELIDELLAIYDTDRATISEHLDEVIENLKQEGVL